MAGLKIGWAYYFTVILCVYVWFKRIMMRTSGRQNQRPIVPDEWHNHTGRVAVAVDLSDGRVAIIEQNTKQSNFLKLRISHTPDTISESWKLLWREHVISHM